MWCVVCVAWLCVFGRSFDAFGDAAGEVGDVDEGIFIEFDVFGCHV